MEGRVGAGFTPAFSTDWLEFVGPLGKRGFRDLCKDSSLVPVITMVVRAGLGKPVHIDGMFSGCRKGGCSPSEELEKVTLETLLLKYILCGYLFETKIDALWILKA